LAAAHQAAFLEYRHSPVVVGIDIYNLEAEAYGARIEKPDGFGIPAITRPLLRDLDDALDLRPFDPDRDGRMPMVLEAARRLKRELPEADVRIPVAGPFSIAFNLLGIGTLCEEAAVRPAEVAAFLRQLARNQEALCQAAVRSGLEVAFFESAAAPPLLSPRQFRAIELPALKLALEVAARQVNHPVPCIMGGNTFPIVDDILSTGTGFVVCNVETDQASFVARVAERAPAVKVRVNLDPVILSGNDLAALEKDVDRILAMAARFPNCLMGTGCLPYETPPENIRHIREYIR